MKRSLQEIVELVVFGLIALLVGTGVLWLLGWIIGLVGSLFMWIAGILWLLLRWIIPVVVIIAAVYALFRLLQRQSKKRAEGSQEGSSGGSGGATVSSSSVTGGASVVKVSEGTAPDTTGSLPPSVVAGRPAGYTPAAAPITTPAPVSASGEPVSPLSVAPEVKPLADEPVLASGEPVVDLEPTPTPLDVDVVEASTEPIAVEVVDAEAVETEPESDEKPKKK